MKENLITGKRLLIVAAVTAVTAGVVLTGIYFYPRLELKADTFPLEAGEALSEDVKAYADMTWKRDEKKASMDFSGVDQERPGSYEAAVVLSGKRYPFTVEVADTKAPDETAPVIKGAKNLTVTIGTTPDYLNGVTAEDETDGDVTKEIMVDSSKADVKKTGTYEVTYQVKDQAGNEAVKEIRVTVKKAAAKLPKVQQSSQNQQPGSAGTADQNAESAGTAPPQPSQPQPESQAGSVDSENSQPPQPESQSDSADFGNSQSSQHAPEPTPEPTPQPEPMPDQGSDNSGGNEKPSDWIDPDTFAPPLTPEEYDEMVNNWPGDL